MGGKRGTRKAGSVGVVVVEEGNCPVLFLAAQAKSGWIGLKGCKCGRSFHTGLGIMSSLRVTDGFLCKVV